MKTPVKTRALRILGALATLLGASVFVPPLVAQASESYDCARLGTWDGSHHYKKGEVVYRTHDRKGTA